VRFLATDLYLIFLSLRQPHIFAKLDSTTGYRKLKLKNHKAAAATATDGALSAVTFITATQAIPALALESFEYF
jgi:hypothetical protein